MKSDATVSNSTSPTGASRQHSPAQYAKVFDQRKRRVRGLWERNGAYHAQLTITDEGTAKKGRPTGPPRGRIRHLVLTVPEAVKVVNKLKVRGVLIGKVYGHLSNEHAQQQAQRANFGPSAGLRLPKCPCEML